MFGQCVKIARFCKHDVAADFVLATGKSHTVREFVDLAFKNLDMPLNWVGQGIKEQGIENSTGKVRVVIDPSYYRPTEVDFLLGDASKAKELLDWKPLTKFKELVALMVKSDYEKVQKRGF